MFKSDVREQARKLVDMLGALIFAGRECPNPRPGTTPPSDSRVGNEPAE